MLLDLREAGETCNLNRVARVLPRYWKGDLIKGKANASSVGTLVERTSGYLMLIKISDSTATSAMEGFRAALNRMPLAVRKA